MLEAGRAVARKRCARLGNVSTQVNAPERVALSQELSEFLIEFSIALHRNAMYPAGHPALRTAAADVVHHVATLLYERASLSIGVARRQLVIEGVATDARNPVLRALAERLHDHHIGALVFHRGVGADEILGVLALLAPERERNEAPLGLGHTERLEAWPNVKLFPLTYEQLELVDEGDEEFDEEEGEGGGAAGNGSRRTRSSQLWIGLARAALAAEETGREPESTEPAHVARAINDHPQAQGYDQVIVGYLLQIADQLRNEKNGAGSTALRRRMSRLVGSLSEDTLHRLVEMGGDTSQRRKFLLDATDGMAVDAVVELVQAASLPSQRPISSAMLRLLSKLSSCAETGGEAVREHADAAVREQVRELIEGWSLDDPNPHLYTVALDSMTRAPQSFTALVSAQHDAEPLRVVQMAIELGAVGPSFEEAAAAVVEKGELGELVPMLVEAPAESPPAAALWNLLATKENLLRLLNAEQVDFETLNRILDHMDGESVANLLLDTLADAESRPTRLGLLGRLSKLGPSIQPQVLRRLQDARWYVQRNMLALLNEIGCPPEFSAAPYIRHPEPAVRREALQLAVNLPAERDRAVCLALADKDGRAFRIGVRALQNGRVPQSAVPLIANRLGEDSLPTDLRTALVRAVKGVRSPLALDGLLRLVVVGKTVLGRPKLAPRSPELLAALAILADTWAGEPRVRAVLARARGSSDAEIRAAGSSSDGA